MMKEFASCFSEHAVKVSDSSCSGGGGGGGGVSSSVSSKSSIISCAENSSSIQTSITTLYRTKLSNTHKELLFKLTWSKTPIGPVLSLALDDDPYNHQYHLWNNSINSQLLRKRKGTRSYISSSTSSNIALYWDYSLAIFNTSPEPISNFYILVIVDAQLALLLGDLARDFYIKSFQHLITSDDDDYTAHFSVLCRKEQLLGHDLFSTTARFTNQGKDHEILIRCKGDTADYSKDSELMVTIDRKRVVQVKRLQWNFRGNQTIFVDGSPVDMMWDVRDWWFTTPPGYAVFMFRKRSALESRLWFEEEMLLHRETGISAFSLFIQAFKMEGDVSILKAN